VKNVSAAAVVICIEALKNTSLVPYSRICVIKNKKLKGVF